MTYTLLDPYDPITWVFYAIIVVIFIGGYLFGRNDGYAAKASPVPCPYCDQLAKPYSTIYHFGTHKAYRSKSIEYRCKNRDCKLGSFTLMEELKEP